MTARSPGPAGLWWALAAALGSLAWVFLYIVALSGEGQEPSARSAFVASFVLGTAAAVLVGPFLRHPVAKTALPSAAAAGQLAWAVLGGFSVGLPLLLPAACSTIVAAVNAEAQGGPVGVAVGVLGSLAIVVLGLALTVAGR